MFDFTDVFLLQSLEQHRSERVGSMQLNDFAVRQMIRHHLLYHAHASTLRSFDAMLPPSVVHVQEKSTTSAVDAPQSSPLQAEDLLTRSLYIPTFTALISSLELRVQLRAAIVAGEIEQTVLPLLHKHWPELLQLSSFQGVLQQLRYQAFIERLRSGDLAAAVVYARAELTMYRGVDHAAALRELYRHSQTARTYIAALPTVLGLLAYNDVAQSPLRVLFDPARRQWLARCVNERVLSQQCNAVVTMSALELAKRQEASIEREAELRRGGAASASSKR
jgi:hypothetical protein